jgi:hypothetical protein
MFKWDNLRKSNIEQLEYLHGKVGEIESSEPWLSEEDPFYRITLRRAYVSANIKERDDWMTRVLHFGAPEE